MALLADPAASDAGVVHLVPLSTSGELDIGLDLPDAAVESLQPDDVAALLPRPDEHAHKYTRGVVGVRAGSVTYPGPACSACGGGVRAVRHGPLRRRRARRGGRGPSRRGVENGRVQAWTVGSGGGPDVATMLAEALLDGVPVVVDADALALVDGPLTVPAVLTPRRRARPG